MNNMSVRQPLVFEFLPCRNPAAVTAVTVGSFRFR